MIPVVREPMTACPPSVDFVSVDDFVPGLVWAPLSASEIYLLPFSLPIQLLCMNVKKSKQIWLKGHTLTKARCWVRYVVVESQRFATIGQDGKSRFGMSASQAKRCSRYWQWPSLAWTHGLLKRAWKLPSSCWMSLQETLLVKIWTDN